jgi:hypothetical protein
MSHLTRDFHNDRQWHHDLVTPPYPRFAMSRHAGAVVLNTAGWVGIRRWDGTSAGYVGRDLTDPSTWEHPYREGRGMFARLHSLQDAG